MNDVLFENKTRVNSANVIDRILDAIVYSLLKRWFDKTYGLQFLRMDSTTQLELLSSITLDRFTGSGDRWLHGKANKANNP